MQRSSQQANRLRVVAALVVVEIGGTNEELRRLDAIDVASPVFERGGLSGSDFRIDRTSARRMPVGHDA